MNPPQGFPHCFRAWRAGRRRATGIVLAVLGLLGSAPVYSAGAAGLLLVCNKGDRTLSIINPATGEQLAAIPENAITGHEVVASSDGRLAFVPIYGNSGVGHAGTDGSLIRVIDLKKQAIVGTIDLGKGVRPHCAVIGPKDKLLYVTTELQEAITIIDPKTFGIIGFIPTGQKESHMLAISHDGKRGYTANVDIGTVSVLDMIQRKVIKIIPISGVTQRISITPDDRRVFTADQIHPRLAVIDTKSDTVAQWIALPGTGYGTAVTPDGHWLLVALNTINQVGLVDLRTMKLVKTLAVPKAPQEILIQPDGQTAYVSCDASKQVAAIDLAQFKVKQLIAAGRGADGLAWAN